MAENDALDHRSEACVEAIQEPKDSSQTANLASELDLKSPSVGTITHSGPENLEVTDTPLAHQMTQKRDHSVENENLGEAKLETNGDVSHGEETGKISPSVESDDQKSTTSEVLVIEEEEAPPRPSKLGVRYYNYQGFANRMQDDGWDYAIEALVAKSNWVNEVVDDERRRDVLEETDKVEDVPAYKPHMASTLDFGDGQRIYRVRLRSAVVIKHLLELASFVDNLASGIKEIEAESTSSIVFCRPFKVFNYLQEGMKKRLIEMETKIAADQDEHFPQRSHLDNKVSSVDGTLDSKEGGTSLMALEEMKCYISFIDERVVPLWRRFEKVTKQPVLKVAYEEIACLFRPGDLVYVPESLTSAKVMHRSALQNVFRVAYFQPQDVPTEIEDGDWKNPSTQTKCCLYCLDHDGDNFKLIWRVVFFERFEEESEKEVTALECYPLRFHAHSDAILKNRVMMGKRFKSIMESSTKHHYYSGWTLVTGMFEEKEDKDKKESDEPEHIESEVIIDVKEAGRHIPEWQDSEEPPSDSDWSWDISHGASIRIWEKPPDSDAVQDRTGTVLGAVEPVPSSHPIHKFRFEASPLVTREDFAYGKDKNKYIADEGLLKNDGNFLKREWTDEDFAVLPKRLLGYVLRERKFARLDINCFQDTKDEDMTTLDNIQMPNKHRTIIRSTVTTHFRKREREKNNDIPVYDPDIIKGKGRGVVILLHGAPGVGKTATAEAVALENKKPLFPITCGDLGTMASDVEGTLKDIFRYAHMWDCILLLDEADVFLTQRDRTDVERNALVSVFLRVLEYYSGILFLTTNRVGSLDEAFRSRVHISLYYRHLTCEDTLAILKASLNRLPRADSLPPGVPLGDGHIMVQDGEIETFVKEQYEAYDDKNKGPWNGRQIRNAVQIATCLAFYEKQSKPVPNSLPAVLTAEHFRTVMDTTADFDAYLKKARRADEAKLAHMQGDRFDDYDSYPAHEPVQYESFTRTSNSSFSTPGQATRQTAEFQGTGRGSARSNKASAAPAQNFPRRPAPVNAKYAEYKQDSSDYYSSGRNTTVYRNQESFDTHADDHLEGEHDIPMNRSIAGRGSGRGGNGSTRQRVYANNIQPPSHMEELDYRSDRNVYYPEDDDQQYLGDHVPAPRSQKNQQQYFGAARGAPAGVEDSGPMLDGRAMNFGTDDTPSKGPRRQIIQEQVGYEASTTAMRGRKVVSGM